MTRDEATGIISDLLIESQDLDRINRKHFFDRSEYPELGKIYEEFVKRPRSTRWFFQAAIDHLIVANSKLGRALK